MDHPGAAHSPSGKVTSESLNDMKLQACAAFLGIAILSTGCTQAVVNKEDMMVNAGFQQVAANTPERKKALQTMPAHKFSMQIRDNKAVWIYPDPTICNCLYVGDQVAYDQYRRMMSERRSENEAQTAAWLNANNAMSYPVSWEAWGQR